MTEKETARGKIEILVERFTEQFESYKSNYNETQTRRDFIDPFFKSLGWDMDNENGYAEAYREVVHEDKIKISGAMKAPDYSFRLNGGKRLFFVEAKKPSVMVKEEIPPAYQIRRYGWSAKLPISIITDFEEFSVYDCTKKPNHDDKSSIARIKYLTFKEYLKEFDFLYDTFSREKVLKGSFDKFVKSDTLKRGTSTVDKEFLTSLDSWRTYLATSISWNNKNLNEEEINFAVQQTIDRLIFLRIAEDRSVEPYENLKHTVGQGDYYKNLFDLFRNADEKYNSGLFDFKKDRISKDLKIDNKVLKNIITDLYYPASPYEFSVLSVEILGAAYEQFLGKVIRITSSHIAKVEEKPEVRKAGGVYYTPQYIVEYIVKNTVGKLVEGRTPKQVEKIKIVDPACGSGSFLIGAFQFLLQWHKDYYSNNGKPSKGSKNNPLTPEGNLTTGEKKRILINNIFGVDIDLNAVEVTKLSLLLKCMEGETEASINNQMKLFHERILPTLDENIKSGNSLIDLDFYDSVLDFGEDKKVKPFNWEKEFPQVFKQGGFDSVIGNPPYVRQELLGDSKMYFQKHYKVYHGMADLYSYFMEKGISLLNESGLFCVIVANKWMKANYGQPLRQWLKTKNIIRIIDFGDLAVFENATTYPCIFIAGKDKVSGEITVTSVASLNFNSLSEYVDEHEIKVETISLQDEGWNLSSGTEQKLLNKIKDVGITLDEYVHQNIYRGVLTGFNKAFVIDKDIKSKLISEDKKSKEIIKPFLVGKDINRYKPPKSDKYLIFTRRGVDIDQYPAIKNHLLQYKKQLVPKPKDFKGEKWEGRKPGNYKWFEIQDTVDYYKEFEKYKILWPGISDKVACFTIDYNNYYGNDNNQLIISDDLYLLGVLNSKLSRFQLTSICDKVQGGFYRLKISYVRLLRIKVVNGKDESRVKDEIITNVQHLLKLNGQISETKLDSERKEIQNKIDYLDEKIDQLVYSIYELSKDEIAVIEGSN